MENRVTGEPVAVFHRTVTGKMEVFMLVAGTAFLAASVFIACNPPPSMQIHTYYATLAGGFLLGFAGVVPPVVARLGGWPRLEIWPDKVRYTTAIGIRKVVDLSRVGNLRLLPGGTIGFHDRALDQALRQAQLSYTACCEKTIYMIGVGPIQTIVDAIGAVHTVPDVPMSDAEADTVLRSYFARCEQHLVKQTAFLAAATTACVIMWLAGTVTRIGAPVAALGMMLFFLLHGMPKEAVRSALPSLAALWLGVPLLIVAVLYALPTGSLPVGLGRP